MIHLLFLLAFLFVAVQARAGDEVTASPKGAFQIVQHYEDNWTQMLRFADGQVRDISLEEGTLWPALYHVSPDEQWILRIQKSGSGDNISFLYHLDKHRQLWRREQQIGELGFAYLAKQAGIPQNLYHTGIGFEAWDLKAGRLYFTIRGSDIDRSGKGISRSLAYGLHDGSISAH